MNFLYNCRKFNMDKLSFINLKMVILVILKFDSINKQVSTSIRYLVIAADLLDSVYEEFQNVFRCDMKMR